MVGHGVDEPHRVAGEVDGLLDEVGQVERVRGGDGDTRVEGGRGGLAGEVDAVTHAARGQAQDAGERVVVLTVGVAAHGARGGPLGPVADAERELDQAYAVREAVVEARHHRAGPLGVGAGDDLHLPQRVLAREGDRELAADVLAQRLVVEGGQLDVAHVPTEVEVRVVDPRPLAVLLDGDLAEDAELEDGAVHEDVGHGLARGGAVEEHQAVDLHEVVGPVHEQPREVLCLDGCRHGGPRASRARR